MRTELHAVASCGSRGVSFVCGIAGYTHKFSSPDSDRIQKATLSLVHRGPDRQAVFETGRVSLGAVRLRIIDLEGGDQPMASPDGDTVIAYNGEIYNFAELRDELAGRGHTFQSRSDTEVLLHAFLEWDTDCFKRLRGMFGVAFWSESRRRLVLGRDRMGIKPLYYALRDGEIYFGSELKAILEHPDIERRLNLDGLDLYLSLNYVPCPHTLVEGVDKLPPGHWLEWRDGQVRTEAYWQLKVDPQPGWTLESAKEELDRLLRASVREHMVSDVPLGIWASGGLDSSAVLHYAASESASKLKTFSVSFEGRSFDESPYFRQIAEFYGTDHHEFDLNTDHDLPAAIEDLSYYSDEPSADAGALPVFFLSRMSRRHVTVALSGEGADELFAGYVTYRADGIAEKLRAVPAPLRRFALAALRRIPVSDDKISLEYKLKRMFEGSLLPADEAHCYWNGTSSTSQKSKFYRGGKPGAIEALYRAGNAPTRGLSRYLWYDQSYYLPDDILYKTDRMSMAHSLEVRPAFLDHRIAEFAASLPDNLKLNGSRQKHVLRELMKGKLPPAILNRGKQGFDIPAHDWLRNALKPLLLETLNPEALRRSGVFDSDAVQGMVRAHLERRANLGYHLWGLLTLFLWMRRWKIESGSPAEARQAQPRLSVYTN